MAAQKPQRTAPIMNGKHVERFIRSAIRRDTDPDEQQLRALLADINTPDLQMFWFRFAGDRAASADVTIPDWKTRERDAVSKLTLAEYQFYPTKKDSNGKWIVVRSELENHVIRCLLRHIRDEREAAREFRSRPLLERLHAWLGMAIAFGMWLAIPLAICVIILDVVLHVDLWRTVTTPAVSAFVVAWIIYFLLGLLLALIQRIKTSRHVTPNG
jgi:hypothetical protein